MKKRVLTAALVIAMAAVLCMTAAAEGEDRRLDIAFGLFSVELPEGVTAGPNTGNELSDFRFETDGMLKLIYANCAPMDEYESTAQRKLNSYISFVFSIAGGKYSETEIREETLENGIRLRWQIMRGAAIHALWFEAFDDQFGYNMCMYGSAETADDEAMLDVMRSFRADPERERDLKEIRQTKLPDGSFVSVEHGLKIRLTDEWNVVPFDDLLRPDTAFVLEKDDGRWMIQLLYTHPVDAGDASGLLNWFLQSQGAGSVAGEPFTVKLEDLGVDALVSEVDANVTMLNVAFVYEGYGYYGLFMWVSDIDAEARPFMLEALRTMTKPE